MSAEKEGTAKQNRRDAKHSAKHELVCQILKGSNACKRTLLPNTGSLSSESKFIPLQMHSSTSTIHCYICHHLDQGRSWPMQNEMEALSRWTIWCQNKNKLSASFIYALHSIFLLPQNCTFLPKVQKLPFINGRLLLLQMRLDSKHWSDVRW